MRTTSPITRSRCCWRGGMASRARIARCAGSGARVCRRGLRCAEAGRHRRPGPYRHGDRASRRGAGPVGQLVGAAREAGGGLPARARPRSRSRATATSFSSPAAPCAQHGADRCEVLAALGADGVLVNVSRGLMVDEPALVARSSSARWAGAALDVFAEEPINARSGQLRQCGARAAYRGLHARSRRRHVRQLRENLRRHFAGEALLTPMHDTPE